MTLEPWTSTFNFTILWNLFFYVLFNCSYFTPPQVYKQCKILKSDKRSIFLVGIKYKNEDN